MSKAVIRETPIHIREVLRTFSMGSLSLTRNAIYVSIDVRKSDSGKAKPALHWWSINFLSDSVNSIMLF